MTQTYDGSKEIIRLIAKKTAAFSIGSGCNALEIAGLMISYFAKNPHEIEEFLTGKYEHDWPEKMLDFLDASKGLLNYIGADGLLHTPEELKAAKAQRLAEKEASQ